MLICHVRLELAAVLVAFVLFCNSLAPWYRVLHHVQGSLYMQEYLSAMDEAMVTSVLLHGSKELPTGLYYSNSSIACLFRRAPVLCF